mmetsp:Transcript_20181/g.52531  ORF Transcript_20181/g.52531 Transcript_20181/m.52531 type:complete len:250 (-) Transcript_20181:877-1626(-)
MRGVAFSQLLEQVQEPQAVSQGSSLHQAIKLAEQLLKVVLRQVASQLLNHGEDIGLDDIKGALSLCGSPQDVQVLRSQQSGLIEHLQDLEDQLCILPLVQVGPQHLPQHIIAVHPGHVFLQRSPAVHLADVFGAVHQEVALARCAQQLVEVGGPQHLQHEHALHLPHLCICSDQCAGACAWAADFMLIHQVLPDLEQVNHEGGQRAVGALPVWVQLLRVCLQRLHKAVLQIHQVLAPKLYRSCFLLLAA